MKSKGMFATDRGLDSSGKPEAGWICGEADLEHN